MSTMSQGSVFVKRENSQLFDVIAYDNLGQPQMTIGEGLSLEAAISRSLGFNARNGRLIAAVIPSGSIENEKLGNLGFEDDSSPVDVSDALDDSDATEGTEDAADDEPEVRFREDVRKDIEKALNGWNYTRLPALGIQFALLRHLEQVEGAILDGKVDCSAHVGIIAKSLERFCSQVIDRQPPTRSRWDDSLDWKSEGFDDGHVGEIHDDELEDYLNHWLNVALRRDHPELFAEAESEEAPA